MTQQSNRFNIQRLNCVIYIIIASLVPVPLYFSFQVIIYEYVCHEQCCGAEPIFRTELTLGSGSPEQSGSINFCSNVVPTKKPGRLWLYTMPRSQEQIIYNMKTDVFHVNTLFFKMNPPPLII